VVLSGANTYGGATDIQAGTVIVDNAQALGETVEGTTVEQARRFAARHQP